MPTGFEVFRTRLKVLVSATITSPSLRPGVDTGQAKKELGGPPRKSRGLSKPVKGDEKGVGNREGSRHQARELVIEAEAVTRPWEA